MINEYNVLSAEMLYFKVVFERGSLNGAARQLNQDVANLSRMITRLESRVGTQLFVRHKSGLHPTSEGVRLYNAVSCAMNTYSEKFSLQDETARPIRMGFSSAIGFAHFSPKISKRLLELRLSPEFSLDSSFNLIEKIKFREIDFALIPSRIKFPGIIAKKIDTEDLVLCGLSSEPSDVLVLHPDMLGAEKIVSSISYQKKWLIGDYFVIAKVVSTHRRLMGLVPRSLLTVIPQLKVIEIYPEKGTITAVSWPGSIGVELMQIL